MRSVIRPPGAIASIALSIRFVQTWFSSEPAASMAGSSGSKSRTIATRFSRSLAEDRQRALEPLVDVDLLAGRLVEVRVALDGADEVGDAPGRFLHLGKQDPQARARRDEAETGGKLIVTHAGRDAIGPFDPDPASTSAVATSNASAVPPPLEHLEELVLRSLASSGSSRVAGTVCSDASAAREMRALSTSAGAPASAIAVNADWRWRSYSRIVAMPAAAAAAGLFSSCASPAASVPTASSFSRSRSTPLIAPLTDSMAGSTWLNCQAGSGGYSYYYVDELTSINSANWTPNGGVTATSSGLTATSTNGGSLISKVTPPTGNNYEVKTTLDLPASGGTYVSYLRATTNAQTGNPATGTFYSLEVMPSFSGSSCNLAMTLRKVILGSQTVLVTGPAPCHQGTTIRFSIVGSYMIVTTDNHPWWAVTDSSITTGYPGVGALQTPSGNSISGVNLGPGDQTQPPSGPSLSTFATSVLPTRFDLKFSGVADDTNGTGIGYYFLYKNGSYVAASIAPEFSVQTLSPGTLYHYSVAAADFHGNFSPQTFFDITTPSAASVVDPRRIGIRPTGAYWGGAGEQIDVLSGNLNFTLPLLKAQARGGGGVPFALTYNSQNWRQDSDTNHTSWNLGSDVGYGYGWKLLAGSLTPFYYGAWGLDHYLFTDSTGAEYRLNQNTGGVWTSSESIYVWYDSNRNRLYFRDGSFWVMGCTSGGSETDSGSMYPTIMESSNGNQILVYYLPGVNLFWPNSSARIQYIQDVRAVNNPHTYTFSYTTDVVPHLYSIQNSISTSEGYTFTFLGTQTLQSPFSTTPTFGGFIALTSVAVSGVGLQYTFVTNGSGELTQAIMPYGGYFKWTYGSTTYSSGHGFTQREVQLRVLSKDGTEEKQYPFVHESVPDAVHSFTSLNDPDGIGQKYWTFPPPGPNIGLLAMYQGIQRPSTILVENDFAWTQYPGTGNSYISSTAATYSGGAQAITNQSVDAYGNVTQLKKYDFGSNTYRTYNYTYLNSSNYTPLYIFNRLTSAAVTDGTNNVTLATNSYDNNQLLDFVNGTPLEWDTSYATQGYRGNLNISVTPSGTSIFKYDKAGNVATTIANGITTNVSTDSSTNFAAPTQISGTDTNWFTWNSFLGLTQDTGANQEYSSTVYDSYARPTTTRSPFGATTTYAYSNTPATVTATTHNRWTKATLDGFGRTVKVETGDGSGTLSVAESVYGPCACSPLGKLVQQAMPHVLNAQNTTWTYYTYDGIGRTLSKATIGSGTQGTSTYSYSATNTNTTVTATDPAGKWKKFSMDSLGHLAIVTEPAPDASTYTTSYTYDLLDHLTQVSMPRPSGTQTRTFNYLKAGVMTAYLQSATNPENGTVSYAYDTTYTNRVATKTDATGQQILYTYDGLARLTQVHHWVSGYEAPCGQEFYYYDTNSFVSNYSGASLGRLTAVQYFGGSLTYSQTGFCDTTFQEMFSYSAPGAKVAKKLRVQRNVPQTQGPPILESVDLDAGFAYDDEGKMTATQYPTYWDDYSHLPQTGPNLGWAYDAMGRLNTMTDVGGNSTIITGSTYGPAGELLQMTGNGTVTETRTYNSVLQLTQLTSNGVNIAYGYPSSNNNGKITSQTDSGETITYAYDSLNRLASATAASWSQTFGFDGFGNLSNVTGNNAPSLGAIYNAATNRISGELADANGNLMGPINGATPSYDVNGRLAAVGYQGVQYSYAPGNKRVWRGVWTNGTLTTDEVTFWSVNGQKLGTYQLAVNYICTVLPRVLCMKALQTGTNYYFGGKLIKNAGGYVGADIRGSIGKYYPYGQEKDTVHNPATGEKFTGYFRDGETSLDYADQRYHLPGQGRFMTPDPYMASGGPADPGSWNRYAYAGGDPVNHKDPTGQDWCWVDYYGSDCLVAGPGSGPGFAPAIYLELTRAITLVAAALDAFKWEVAIPDCTVEVSYRPVYAFSVKGKPIPTGKYHIIVTTISDGLQIVYEGEPEPSPALCVPVPGSGSTSCTTNSLLTGETSPNGQQGLGTPWKTIPNAGWACAEIAVANNMYNFSGRLHYVLNGAPNSNSYAYTLLSHAGLLSDVGLPPPNTPGWGYDVITNPLGYR